MASLKRDLWKIEREIGSILSSVDKFILDAVVKKNVRSANTTIKTHEKKLRNLTKNLILPLTTAETVHNLPSKQLTTDELEIFKVWAKTSYSPITNK